MTVYHIHIAFLNSVSQKSNLKQLNKMYLAVNFRCELIHNEQLIIFLDLSTKHWSHSPTGWQFCP